MKTVVLASTIAALFSVTANAASLDVHGEIKVNGNVVIDNEGNFVGNGSDVTPPPSADSINFSDYFVSGIKQTFEANSLWGSDWSKETHILTFNNNGQFQLDVLSLAGEYLWYHKETPTEDGYTSESGPSEDEILGRSIVKVDSLLELPETAYINSVYGKIQKVENYDQQARDGYNHMYTSHASFALLGKLSFDNGYVQSDDCIAITYQEELPEYQVVCKDMGVVEVSRYDFNKTMTEFEVIGALQAAQPHTTAQAATLAAQRAQTQD
jgi:hypothetical protein